MKMGNAVTWSIEMKLGSVLLLDGQDAGTSGLHLSTMSLSVIRHM